MKLKWRIGNAISDLRYGIHWVDTWLADKQFRLQEVDGLTHRRYRSAFLRRR